MLFFFFRLPFWVLFLRVQIDSLSSIGTRPASLTPTPLPTPPCLVRHSTPTQVATNLKLLQVSNVETYIVVRSIVPICTLGLEMAYLNTPWPGLRTASSLLVIAAGAFGYVWGVPFK